MCEILKPNWKSKNVLAGGLVIGINTVKIKILLFVYGLVIYILCSYVTIFRQWFIYGLLCSYLYGVVLIYWTNHNNNNNSFTDLSLFHTILICLYMRQNENLIMPPPYWHMWVVFVRARFSTISPQKISTAASICSPIRLCSICT